MPAAGSPTVRWSAAIVAALTALVAATRFAGDALWPCSAACQGGAHYQSLWGVAVHVPAVAMMGLIGVLAAAGRLGLAAGLAWVAIGVSAFFLMVMLRLGIACPYCASVHAGVIATAVLLAAAAPPAWWLKGLLAALGFLGVHAAFHPGLVEDGPADPAASFLAADPQPHALAADPGTVRRIDAVRRLGRVDAPLTLELAVDLHCPHCAETHGPLLDAVRPAVESGRVQVLCRFLVRKSAPTGGDLARHALAAGDPARFRLLVATLLGTPEGRGWDGVRSRVAEVQDPRPIEAACASDAAAIEAVLAGDADRLRRLGCRQTPFAALSEGGRELRRWQGEAATPAAIAAAFAQAP